MKKLTFKFTSLMAAALVLCLVGFNRGAVSFAGGDDLIGSLPIKYPSESSTASPPLVPASGGDGEESVIPVSFVMEGTMRDVEALVVDAFGVGYVKVEKTCKPDIFKYVFHGNVIIDLDRRLLMASNVIMATRPGHSYLNSKGIVSWKGEMVNVFKVKNEELVLPYQNLLSSGIADKGAVGVKFYKPKSFGAFLNLVAGPNMVRINSVTH